MRTISILLAFVLIVAEVGAIARGHAPAPQGETQTITKTVPAGAALEYRIQGSLVQSMHIEPGVYRITIERLQ